MGNPLVIEAPPRVRHRADTHTEVGYSDEEPGSWARVRFRAVCVDRTGYKRRRHSWDLDRNCIFCGWPKVR